MGKEWKKARKDTKNTLTFSIIFPMEGLDPGQDTEQAHWFKLREKNISPFSRQSRRKVSSSKLLTEFTLGKMPVKK